MEAQKPQSLLNKDLYIVRFLFLLCKIRKNKQNNIHYYNYRNLAAYCSFSNLCAVRLRENTRCSLPNSQCGRTTCSLPLQYDFSSAIERLHDPFFSMVHSIKSILDQIERTYAMRCSSRLVLSSPNPDYYFMWVHVDMVWNVSLQYDHWIFVKLTMKHIKWGYLYILSSEYTQLWKLRWNLNIPGSRLATRLPGKSSPPAGKPLLMLRGTEKGRWSAARVNDNQLLFLVTRKGLPWRSGVKTMATMAA